VNRGFNPTLRTAAGIDEKKTWELAHQTFPTRSGKPESRTQKKKKNKRRKVNKRRKKGPKVFPRAARVFFGGKKEKGLGKKKGDDYARGERELRLAQENRQLIKKMRSDFPTLGGVGEMWGEMRRRRSENREKLEKRPSAIHTQKKNNFTQRSRKGDSQECKGHKGQRKKRDPLEGSRSSTEKNIDRMPI